MGLLICVVSIGFFSSLLLVDQWSKARWRESEERRRAKAELYRVAGLVARQRLAWSRDPAFDSRVCRDCGGLGDCDQGRCIEELRWKLER